MNEQELDQLFDSHGWNIECYSPYEVRSKDDQTSFASGEAAAILEEYFKQKNKDALTEIMQLSNFPSSIKDKLEKAWELLKEAEKENLERHGKSLDLHYEMDEIDMTIDGLK